MTDPAVATDSYAENMRRQGHTAALIAAYLALVAALRAATSTEDIQAAVTRDIPPLASAIDAYVQQQTGMDALVVAPISQASARQRAGRAGRTV